MTPPRRPSRRIPPKSRGPRPQVPPDASGAGPEDVTGEGVSFTSAPSGGPAVRPGSRAANRAAKRATSPRPKVTRGRSSRGSNTGLIVLAVIGVAIGAAVIAIGNPFGSPAASPTASAAGSPSAGATFGDGTCPTSQPAALPGGQTRTVTIETELGDIVIEVEGAFSPIAAGNFVALATCKYYDGVVFHRTPTLEDGTPFVIQGGDPNGNGTGGPGYTIADEPVAKAYVRGTVAMARTQQANSQGSQFFIVLDDKSGPILTGGQYAIFGEVVSGMEVADAIYQASEGEELPANPIAMISVTVTDGPAASASPAASGSPAPTAAASVAPSPTAPIQ